MQKRILTMDLHTHPLEKKMNMKDYWKQALDKGLNAIAVTEHSEYSPRKAYELAVTTKPEEITLIPGAELNTSIGHVLAYSHSQELYEMKELFEGKKEISELIEFAGKEKIHLSIAHPWGFSYDSAAFILGERKLKKLVEKNKIGIEVYNGMIGQVTDFIYGSKALRKPLNLFCYLQENRVAKKTRITKITNRLKKEIDGRRFEMYARSLNTIQLGNEASFITAGSDAHYSNRIGCGMVKLNAKEKRKELTAKNILNELTKKDKEILWSGPFVEETKEGYSKPGAQITKKELSEGIKYAAKAALSSKIKIKENKN